MKQRILSGAVLVAFCAAIIVFDQNVPIALNVVVGLISLVSVMELIRAMGVERKLFLSLPSLVTAFLIPFARDDLQLLVYAIFTAALFSGMIFYHKETTFREVGVLYSMAVMIPSALQCLVALRDMGDQTVGHGMYYTLLAVFAAWVADAGAYFCGTFWGRHKMCPEISPKKTWEGAAGGMAVNILVMLLSGFVLKRFYGGDPMMNYGVLFLIGSVGSAVSILGDLSFSLIKRSCHIKDFGQAIPGHGGILDRFDSVIFTAPFVYLVARWLPPISG